MIISVIVPLYNGEKYLERCIESILNQSNENLEILLIDDGSTDSSIHICEKYKRLDNRVKIYNIPHKGVSAARNTGIIKATGDYFTFVDCDDYIENNMIQSYFNAIDLEPDLDLIIWSCIRIRTYYTAWMD